jgi:hypothetical protein
MRSTGIPAAVFAVVLAAARAGKKPIFLEAWAPW